jgi:hypothetical protein
MLTLKYISLHIIAEGDFWLGLENMHALTLSNKYMLWIIIHDERRVPHVLPYDSFSVKDESTNYALSVAGYHGKLSQIWYDDDDIPFVTKDSTYFENAKIPEEF